MSVLFCLLIFILFSFCVCSCCFTDPVVWLSCDDDDDDDDDTDDDALQRWEGGFPVQNIRRRVAEPYQVPGDSVSVNVY